jgi:6,7-dimethyl-8-ribityllumazine synthase
MSSQSNHPQATFQLNEQAKKKKVGIVTAGWSPQITYALRDKAKETLLNAGIEEDNIILKEVPGSFELPLGAQFLFEYAAADAVICIGCLIKGDTPHFHYISESVSLALGQLALRANRPVGFGVLTVDSLEQAEARSGGEHGNKGEEAALAVLQMLSFKEDVRTQKKSGSIGFGSSLSKD